MKICKHYIGEGHCKYHSKNPKCAHYGSSHRVKDYKYQYINISSNLQIKQQLILKWSTTVNVCLLLFEVLQFTIYMFSSQINSTTIFSEDQDPCDNSKAGDIW